MTWSENFIERIENTPGHFGRLANEARELAWKARRYRDHKRFDLSSGVVLTMYHLIGQAKPGQEWECVAIRTHLRALELEMDDIQDNRVAEILAEVEECTGTLLVKSESGETLAEVPFQENIKCL